MTQRSLQEPQNCRICLQANENLIISPCHCTGSVGFIHESCFIQWVKHLREENSPRLSKNSKNKIYTIVCELCTHQIQFTLEFMIKYTAAIIKKIICVLALPFFALGVFIALGILLVKIGESDKEYDLSLRMFSLIILMIVGFCCMISIVISVARIIDQILIRNSTVSNFKILSK